MGKRISFFTFGCRLNQAETSSIKAGFKEQGYEIACADQSPDLIVINTCTVTENGDADTRKLVNRLARNNPKTEIALIGCQAQMQGKELLNLPNVRYVVGNARKMDLPSMLTGKHALAEPVLDVTPIPQKNFEMPSDAIDPSHTRANLKIQDGCDFFCFFCVIPYARGRARSREFHDLIREAKNLIAADYNEIVLTGVNIGTYQCGRKKFSDVVSELDSLPGLRRLRISSIEPTTIPAELLDRMSPDSTLCRHLHVPLQSGSDQLLFKMNRRYTAAEYSEFMLRAHRKVGDICLGTDVIVGYPRESDQAFDETVDVLNFLPLSYIHVFSYSERAEAKSKRFNDQVPKDKIRHRSKVLRQLSDHKRKRFMDRLIRSTAEVLFEQKKHGFWTGVTDNYVRVKVESDLDLRNRLLPVRLDRIDGREIIGSLA
jgi:threonylcarbamoyladenosine tRNA methylthiotransferase MtaB